MKIFLLSLLSLFSFGVYAQERTENSDLRNKKMIFEMKDVDKNKGWSFSLHASVKGEYFLHFVNTKKHEDILKIAQSKAQHLDEEFVDVFINSKYLMKERKSTKKCTKKLYLNLRGEEQDICSDEKLKINKIEEFLAMKKNDFSLSSKK